MGFHSLSEARSFALHEEVSARLAAKPELLERARERVQKWLQDPPAHPYAAAWSDLLLSPLSELQSALTDRGERMTALRQASPFAGALDNRTRWNILRRPELRGHETS